MIVEIESYKGDTLLSGKQITYQEFLHQVKEIESDYDRILDNFIAMLCRRYGWITMTEKEPNSTYVYDRDIKKIYTMS